MEPPPTTPHQQASTEIVDNHPASHVGSQPQQYQMCENLVDIGNENAPPTAHQPSATTGVSSSAYLYGQQPQAAQWVMDFAQNVNDMNMIRSQQQYYPMSGNMVNIGNKHVPPSAVHQQERCPVPSLYGQQKEWNPDQPWVMDGAQNLNIMNMPQSQQRNYPVDLANLGNVNVPPTAHQQGMGFQRSAAATTGVSTSASLYDQQQQQALDDQQKQALADQQWVLDFVQNVNAISERRTELLVNHYPGLVFLLKNFLGISTPSGLGSSHLAMDDRAHSSYDIRGRGRERTPYKSKQRRPHSVGQLHLYRNHGTREPSRAPSMSSLDSTQSFTVCWQIDKEWVKRALHLSGLETRDELNTELRALIAPDGPHRDLQFKSIQKKLLRTQQELDIIPKYKRTAAVDDQGEEEVIAEAPDHDQSVNINEQPPEMEYMGGDDQQDE